jgi:hypothetical protein
MKIFSFITHRTVPSELSKPSETFLSPINGTFRAESETASRFSVQIEPGKKNLFTY